MSVAKPLPHDSASLHVSGQARYVDDIPVPAATLHLAFGLSPVAHGDIQKLDLDAVYAAKGVVAVYTATDIIGKNDVSPAPMPEPFLAEEAVHYVGQPVFLVAADTHLNARKAARLAKFDISEHPAVITMEDAIEAMDQFEDPIVFENGDIAGLGEAPHQVRGSIDIGAQEHFYLEGQAALAMPQDNDDMLIHSSTQHPSEIQHKVSAALDVPYHSIRVETRRMGGGFGGKESQGNSLAVACAIAARLTGRPCKMRYDRDDDMTITGKRHDFRIQYKVGFDDTGRINAIDFTQYARCGWSIDLSLPVADRAMLHADNAYYLPNVRITSHRLRTNTQSATAYRGFGGPQGMLGIERVIDHIASYLAIDPLKVRRRNYYAPMVDNSDSSISGTLKPQVTPFHMPVVDFILNEMTDQLVETSDYHNRRKTIESWNAKQSVLKRGIALTPVKFGISFTLTHLNQAGALVHIYSDGSIAINHGGTEMGQGLFQKVAQVAASCFDVHIECVKITATDTAKVPNTSATAASSGSDLNGMAVLNACETIKARLIDFLSSKFDGDVKFANNLIKTGGKTMSFNEAIALAYANRISLSSTGFYATPNIEWDRTKGQGRPFFYFAYGASVSEAVINTLTGENRILRTDILHDCGKSLNPALDIGQIEGGYVQGAGWLTTEELVWDASGRLRTHAPSTYKIPACSDRPDILNVALFDAENPAQTIYRSKAVGEPPFMHGISAFLALSDAIAASGDSMRYPNLQAPATPEAILKAVMKQQGKDW